MPKAPATPLPTLPDLLHQEGDQSALADPPASYEAALLELEQLVARLDAGQLPLEQLLAGYRRGAALLAFCRERLAAVEHQIQLLDDGQLKPWAPA